MQEENEKPWIQYQQMEPGKLYHSRVLFGTVEVVEVDNKRQYYWNKWDKRVPIFPLLTNIVREATC